MCQWPFKGHTNDGTWCLMNLFCATWKGPGMTFSHNGLLRAFAKAANEWTQMERNLVVVERPDHLVVMTLFLVALGCSPQSETLFKIPFIKSLWSHSSSQYSPAAVSLAVLDVWSALVTCLLFRIARHWPTDPSSAPSLVEWVHHSASHRRRLWGPGFKSHRINKWVVTLFTFRGYKSVAALVWERRRQISDGEEMSVNVTKLT